MRFPRNAKIFRGHLDAAPFAGVFFLLVLFLGLHSALIGARGLRLKLPEADEGEASPYPALVLMVDAGGTLYYRNQAVPFMEDLLTRLREDTRRAPGPVTLVIHADKSVSADLLVRLGRLARQAGVAEALVATQPRPITRPEVVPAEVAP